MQLERNWIAHCPAPGCNHSQPGAGFHILDRCRCRVVGIRKIKSCTNVRDAKSLSLRNAVGQGQWAPTLEAREQACEIVGPEHFAFIPSPFGLAESGGTHGLFFRDLPR